MSNGNGLGEFLVALSGGGAAHTAEVQNSAMRQAGLLEDARRKRDQNLGIAAITPDSIQAAQGNPQGQASLVAALIHAGVDPRQLSGYQLDQQQVSGLQGAPEALRGLGYTDQQATAGGTLINANRGANIDNTIQGLMRLQVPVAGTAAVPQGEPSLMHAMGQDTTKVADGVAYNPFGQSDQQISATPIGAATIAEKHAAAGEHAAHSRLFDTQTAAGGFNPRTSGGDTGMLGAAPNPDGAHGDDFIKMLNPTAAAQVKALDEGRMAFPTGTALKAPYWQQMLSDVAQYDPSFEASNYGARAKTRSDFTAGKSAQTINALNTVLGHMGELSDRAQALNNTRFPSYNALANGLLNATGDPRMREFDATKKAVVDEMTRVYRGTGGSEADIKAWSEALNGAGSPEQLQGTIGQISELLQSKINALGDQYRQGMGTIADHTSFISPKSEATLHRLEQRGGVPHHDDEPSLGGMMSPAAPSAAQAAPAATPAYRAVDPTTGHAVVWNGAAWVSEQ